MDRIDNGVLTVSGQRQENKFKKKKYVIKLIHFPTMTVPSKKKRVDDKQDENPKYLLARLLLSLLE